MKKLNKPQHLNKNIKNLIKYCFFTLIFSWFFFNFVFPLDFYSDFFAITLILTPLLGAIISLERTKEWGFTKSSVGLSLIFFAFGLIMWFVGQAFYFIDSKISTPLELYEFFFVFIDPFYLLGVFFLAKSIGTFKYFKANLSLLILPILILVINLLVVSFFYSRDFIELLLSYNVEDLYIFGSIVLATFVVSIMLFSKKLGGQFKAALLYILIGILFQYLGDNLYAYLDAEKANGSLADLLFFSSVSFITYGMYQLDPDKLNE
jgi:hypothetical protein